MPNDTKLTKEFRYQTNIVIIVFGIMASIGVLVLLNKSWAELRTKKSEADSLQVKVNAVNQLDQQRVKHQSDFSELETFFPKGESGVAQVARSMELLAASNQLIMILNFEDFPDPVDIGGVYQQGLGMNIILEGSYQSVVNWVRGIEALPYFIEIVEVKIGLPSEGSGVKAEFDGIIYLDKTGE